MEVHCNLCKQVRKVEDCWCCINGPERHYECKATTDCESIRKEREAFEIEKKKKEEAEEKEKRKLERKKQRALEKEQKKKEEAQIREAEETQSPELILWESSYRRPGFFQRVTSYFYNTIAYEKVKTN